MPPEISLRVAQGADSESLLAIYAPVVLETFISFEQEVPAIAAIAERIETTLENFPWLVAAREDRILGYAYASAHRERAAYRWSVDTTVYVAQDARRHGIGARLYGSLLAILRLQEFRSAFAGIALPNPASVRLHEAAGFEPLGVYADVGYKLGAWRSVGWWRLGLTARDGEPSKPVPFRGLIGTDRLRAAIA
jgi:L-amino acid N-acyltransferase YncA